MVFNETRRAGISFKAAVLFVIAGVLWSLIAGYLPKSQKHIEASVLAYMPAPGELLGISSSYIPPTLQGIKLYQDAPFTFGFIVDEGSLPLSEKQLEEESSKLIRYFLAALTIPAEDLWVNLSPYEHSRVIPQELGKTELGQDLLAEDYLLKQLMASLTYPESPLGERFWKKIYQQVYEAFGTTKIPIDTFNKIWIIPERAVVYEEEDHAFVGETHLKVMMEEDYLSLRNRQQTLNTGYQTKLKEKDVENINNFSSAIMKEIVLPDIEKDVNEGKNFGRLRQIYHSLILATWFKQKLKKYVDEQVKKGNFTLDDIYIDKKKIKGVGTDDPQIAEQIYDRYLEAYKKGVYRYIKKEWDSYSNKQVSRNYYSGGFCGEGVYPLVQGATFGVGSLSSMKKEELLEDKNRYPDHFFEIKISPMERESDDNETERQNEIGSAVSNKNEQLNDVEAIADQSKVQQNENTSSPAGKLSLSKRLNDVRQKVSSFLGRFFHLSAVKDEAVQEEVNRMIKQIGDEGTSDDMRGNLAFDLTNVLWNNRAIKLTLQQAGVLIEEIKHKGTTTETLLNLVFAFRDATANSPELAELLLLAISDEGTSDNARENLALALKETLGFNRNRAIKLTLEQAGALLDWIKDKETSNSTCWQMVCAFEEAAVNNPELVGLLIPAIGDGAANDQWHEWLASILTRSITNNPSILGTVLQDWANVLMEMPSDFYERAKTDADLQQKITECLTNLPDDGATLLAMEIKRNEYISQKEKQNNPLSAEQKSLPIPEMARAIYKFPWDKFCEIMDEHYEGLHTNPEAVIERITEELSRGSSSGIKDGGEESVSKQPENTSSPIGKISLRERLNNACQSVSAFLGNIFHPILVYKIRRVLADINDKKTSDDMRGHLASDLWNALLNNRTIKLTQEQDRVLIYWIKDETTSDGTRGHLASALGRALENNRAIQLTKEQAGVLIYWIKDERTNNYTRRQLASVLGDALKNNHEIQLTEEQAGVLIDWIEDETTSDNTRWNLASVLGGALKNNRAIKLTKEQVGVLIGWIKDEKTSDIVHGELALAFGWAIANNSALVDLVFAEVNDEEMSDHTRVYLASVLRSALSNNRAIRLTQENAGILIELIKREGISDGVRRYLASALGDAIANNPSLVDLVFLEIGDDGTSDGTRGHLASAFGVALKTNRAIQLTKEQAGVLGNWIKDERTSGYTHGHLASALTQALINKPSVLGIILQDWANVLEQMPDDFYERAKTDDNLQQQIKDCLIKLPNEDPTVLSAMAIKRKQYFIHKEKQRQPLSDAQKNLSIPYEAIGVYDLPWNDFCEILDKNYYELHTNPEAVIGRLTEELVQGFSLGIRGGEEESVSKQPKNTSSPIGKISLRERLNNAYQQVSAFWESIRNLILSYRVEQLLARINDERTRDKRRNNLAAALGKVLVNHRTVSLNSKQAGVLVRWIKDEGTSDNARGGLAYALNKALANDHAIKLTEKQAGVLINWIKHEKTGHDTRNSLAFTLTRAIINNPSVLKEIPEDWANVLAEMPSNFYGCAPGDYSTRVEIKECLTKLPVDDQVVLSAMEIKRGEYITWREQRYRHTAYPLQPLSSELKYLPIPDKAIGVYKLPWKDFCRIMDEHYEELHTNPEAVIEKLTGELSQVSSSAVKDEQEEVKKMIAEIGDEKTSDDKRMKLADALEEIFESNRTIKLIPEQVEIFIKWIKHEGMDEATLWRLAFAFGRAVANNPELIKLLITEINDKRTSDIARRVLVVALGVIFQDNRVIKLTSEQVEILIAWIKNGETSNETRMALSSVLAQAVANNLEQTKILITEINDEGTSYEVHWWLTNAVGRAAENNPEQVELIISAINDEWINDVGREWLGLSLAQTLRNNRATTLTSEQIGVLMGWIKGEKTSDDVLRWLIDALTQTLINNPLVLTEIPEDWANVLMEMPSDFYERAKGSEDLQKEITTCIAKLPNDDQAARFAMGMKRNEYFAWRVQQSRSLSDEQKSLPIPDEAIGVYKLPWKDFCRIMDEHYEELHTNPEAVLEDLIREGDKSASSAINGEKAEDNFQRQTKDLSHIFQMIDEKALQSHFLKLHLKYRDLSKGLGYSAFMGEVHKVLQEPDQPVSFKPQHVELIRCYFENLAGIPPQLTPQKERLIRSLGFDLAKNLQQACRSGRINAAGDVTFREIRRFKEIFSRYYLLDRKNMLSNLYTYFILTSWTVYGRFITPESRREFGRVMKETFVKEGYSSLFVMSSVTLGSELSEEDMEQLFDYGRFDAVSGEYKEAMNLLPSVRKIRAAAERARACEMPLFLFLQREQFPDAVVNALESEASAVFPMTLSGYTQNKEFIGMNIPDEQGKVRFFSGTVERVIGYSRAHSGQQVYLYFENPDFTEPHIRTSLHSLLLERKFKTQGGRGVDSVEEDLPDNLQVVLSMDSEEDIGDESFMDRAAGYYLSMPAHEEVKQYLREVVGLREEVAAYLVDNVYVSLKATRLTDSLATVQDIVQIGYYLSGRIKDNNFTKSVLDVAREEAAMHFLSRLSLSQDLPVRQAVSKALGVSDGVYADTEILNEGSALNFGGVHLELSQDSRFRKFLENQWKQGNRLRFNEALEAFVADEDYYVTSTEEKMFCLLARAYKYGNAPVIFLQGFSGEGKTTIARVFMDMVGLECKEYSINRETQLSLFRGGLMLSKDGLSMRQSEYWQKLSLDEQGVVYNEADTHPALLEWMYSLILGRKWRLDTEYSATDTEETRRLDYGKRQFHIFTGNMRSKVPDIILDNFPAAYKMERSPEDTLEIIKRTVLQQNERSEAAIRLQEAEDRAGDLNNIYNNLRQGIRDGEFSSNREVTPREIKRFVQLFFWFMEQGVNSDTSFGYTLELVFVRMWDNFADMAKARQIIVLRVGDLSPPSEREILSWVGKQDFPLKVPVMVLHNGTFSQQELRENLLPLSSEAVEHKIHLSNDHSSHNLIGGIGPVNGNSEQVGIRPGTLSWVILQAHLNDRVNYCWVTGYRDLNPQVAPVLNDFFQTGWLPVDDLLRDEALVNEVIGKAAAEYQRLSREYKEETSEELPRSIEELSLPQRREFCRYLIGYKPQTLIFRMVDTAEQKTKLYSADIDRFLVVNVSQVFDRAFVQNYVRAHYQGSFNSLVEQCAAEVFSLYQRQQEQELYFYNRLNLDLIDVFIKEVMSKGSSEEAVRLLAWHILGKGLSVDDREQEDAEARIADYRQSYAQTIGFAPEKVTYSRRFAKRADGWHFVISARLNDSGQSFDLAEQKTLYDDVQQEDAYGKYAFTQNGRLIHVRLQAPLQVRLSQQASILIFEHYHMPVILEGDQGGGKTSSLNDLCNATGYQYYEEGMFEDIGLTTLLGSLTLRQRNIVLNTLDTDSEGRYILKFLRAFTEGGRYILDEGAVSEGADYLLRWLVEVSRQDEIDLGTFHPGLSGVIIKRSPYFWLEITQNLHYKTKGRRPPSYETELHTAKLYMDNKYSDSDCAILVDYYLEGDNMPGTLKDSLIRLYQFMGKRHPQKRTISPRDLIDLVLIIRPVLGDQAQDISQRVQEAIWVTFVEGLIDHAERKETMNIVQEVFPQYNKEVEYSIEVNNRGHSDIAEEEIAHLKASEMMMSKVKAVEYALSGIGRQVLIHEEKGSKAIEFLQLLAQQSGRRLVVFEGHPYVTVKHLLEGESFQFEDFQEVAPGVIASRRKAKDEFGRTLGVIGRYLIEKDKIDSVPEEERIPTLIAIPNVEAIPTSELVKLNQVIDTREIMRGNKMYVLPPWVTIVPVARDLKKLTSPFANRFRKIGLPFYGDVHDLYSVVSALYPNVSEDEVGLLLEISGMAQQRCEDSGFELSRDYNFNRGEVFELSLRVQMYKQQDWQAVPGGRPAGQVQRNPLWYVVKAVHYVYRKAMCPEDLSRFDRNIMVGGVLKARFPDVGDDTLDNYYRHLIEQIRQDEGMPVYEEYSTEISFDDLLPDQVYVCENDIELYRNGDNLVVLTGSQAYQVNINDARQGIVLSKDLRVKVTDTAVVLTTRLLSSYGKEQLSKDDANRKRALPLGEMSVNDYMYPAQSLKEVTVSLLQATQSLRAATGKIILPRLVLLAGETGTGKTSALKMLTQAEGVPLVRINPYRDMPAQALTFGVSLGEDIEMTVGEFLASCGKINGKRVSTQFPLSERVRRLVDEANITSDAWYLLDPVARGQRKFNVETGSGESVEIELDVEGDTILTYNPPERYGGTGKGSSRFIFPEVLTARGVKLYLGEPLKEYTRDEMDKIIEQLYLRGEAYFEREKVKSTLPRKKVRAGRQEFFHVDEDVLEVTNLDIPAAQDYQQIRETMSQFEVQKAQIEQESIQEVPPERIQERKEQIKRLFSYDEKQVAVCLEDFRRNHQQAGDLQNYLYFSMNILRPLLTGILLHQVEDAFLSTVRAATEEFDENLMRIIDRFDYVVSRQEGKLILSEVLIVMDQIDKLFQAEGVFLENFSIQEFNRASQKSLFAIDFKAYPIAERLSIDTGHLRAVLGEKSFNQSFPDSVVPDGIMLARLSEDGTLGYYNGRDVILVYLDDMKERLAVFYHESGHVGSQNAAKQNQDMHNAILKNEEIHSMLFPLLFMEDYRWYVNEELMPRVEKAADGRALKDSYYPLAAKAILNAFSQKHGWEERAGGDNYDYDLNGAQAIARKMSRFSLQEVRATAADIYNNPRSYFSGVEKGTYHQETIEASFGGRMRSFGLTPGLTVNPRLKTKVIAKSKGEHTVDIPGNERELIDDRKYQEMVLEGMLFEELPRPVQSVMDAYQKLFAAEKEDDITKQRYSSEGGIDVNPEAVAESNIDRMFILPPKQEDDRGMAQNAFFIIDVSGSITSDEELKLNLTKMLLHYGAFMLHLSARNPDLNIGLATISTKMHILFDFTAWQRAKTQKQKEKLLLDKLRIIWSTGDGGGIETKAILDALSEVKFPQPAGKDCKNVVYVWTDGQETGVGGEALQEMIRDFQQGKNEYEGLSRKRGKVDFVHIGIELTDEGEALRENYPCSLNQKGGTSAHNYLEALLKIGMLQVKDKLEGDLSDKINSSPVEAKDSNISNEYKESAILKESIGEHSLPASSAVKDEQVEVNRIIEKISNEKASDSERMRWFTLLALTLKNNPAIQLAERQAKVLMKLIKYEGLNGFERRQVGTVIGENSALINSFLSEIGDERTCDDARGWLADALQSALLDNPTIQLTEKQVEVLRDWMKQKETSNSTCGYLASALTQAIINNPAVLKEITKDWANVLAEMPDNFYERAKADNILQQQIIACLIQLPTDEESVRPVMEIKRNEYIAWRVQRGRALSEEQKSLSIPDIITVIYKFPWNDFCRIMDAHYYELHTNPEETLNKLAGELDQVFSSAVKDEEVQERVNLMVVKIGDREMSDDERKVLAYELQVVIAGNRVIKLSLAQAEILRKRMKRKETSLDTAEMLAGAFKEAATNNPELVELLISEIRNKGTGDKVRGELACGIASTIIQLTEDDAKMLVSWIKYEGTNDGTRRYLASALGQVLRNNRAIQLTKEDARVLIYWMKHKRTSNEAGWQLTLALKEATTNNPELVELLILEISNEGTSDNIRGCLFHALRFALERNPAIQLTEDQAGVLIYWMKHESTNNDIRGQLTLTLKEAATNNPELVGLFISEIQKLGSNWLYFALHTALNKRAIKPTLKQVEVLMEWIKRKGTSDDTRRWLASVLTQAIINNPLVLKEIPEDWANVLELMPPDFYERAKTDDNLQQKITACLKNLPDLEQAALSAMEIKRGEYIAYREKQGNPLSDEQKGLPILDMAIGVYKLPWEEFCRIMDAHYYELHKNPEETLAKLADELAQVSSSAVKDKEAQIDVDQVITEIGNEHTVEERRKNLVFAFRVALMTNGEVKLTETQTNVLIDWIKKESFSKNVQVQLQSLLGWAAVNNSELIKLLISEINKEVASDETRKHLAIAIEMALKNNRTIELTLEQIGILVAWIRYGGTSNGTRKELAFAFTQAVLNGPSILKEIPEDWANVLAEMPEAFYERAKAYERLKPDAPLQREITACLKNLPDLEQAALSAMEIKRKEYIAYREKQGNFLNDEQKQRPIPDSITVIYKFPWDKFCKIMDAYYDDLHKNPEETLAKLADELARSSSSAVKDKDAQKNVNRMIEEIGNEKISDGMRKEWAFTLVQALVNNSTIRLTKEQAGVLIDWIKDKTTSNDTRLKLSLALGLAIENNRAIQLTKEQVGALLYWTKDERTNYYARQWLANALTQAIINDPAVLREIQEDWANVLEQMADDFYERAKTDNNLRQQIRDCLIKLPNEDQTTLLAMGIKRNEYIEWRKQQSRPLSKEQTNLPIPDRAIGVYKLPWNRFCEIMDEYYDALHINPEAVIEVLTEVDRMVAEIDDDNMSDMRRGAVAMDVGNTLRDSRIDSRRIKLTSEQVRVFIKRIKQDIASDDTRWYLAFTLGQAIANGSEQIGWLILEIDEESPINNRIRREWAYALSIALANNRDEIKLSSEQAGVLIKWIKREDVSDRACAYLIIALDNGLINNHEIKLSSEQAGVLIAWIRRDDISDDRRHLLAVTLGRVLANNREIKLSIDEAEALMEWIRQKPKWMVHDPREKLAAALGYAIANNPGLLVERYILEIEDDGTIDDVRGYLAIVFKMALANNFTIKLELKRAEVLMKWIKHNMTSDKTRGLLVLAFTQAIINGPAVLREIQEDWANVLELMAEDFYERAKTDANLQLQQGISACLKNLPDLEQAALSAMEIKRGEYIVWRAQQSRPLSDEQKSLPVFDTAIGVYKLPWNEFCKIMDAHYEGLHINPEEILEKLIGADSLTASSAVKEKTQKDVNWMIEEINAGGISNYARVDLASALSAALANNRTLKLTLEQAGVLLYWIKQEGVSDYTCWELAFALNWATVSNPALVDLLFSEITHEGTSDDTRGWLVFTLREALANNRTLKLTLGQAGVLLDWIKHEGTSNYMRGELAFALSVALANNRTLRLTLDQAGVLLYWIKHEGTTSDDTRGWLASALSAALANNRTLKLTLGQAGVLIDWIKQKGISDGTRRQLVSTLTQIIINNPSVLGAIPEDWANVLELMAEDFYERAKTDDNLQQKIAGCLIKLPNDDQVVLSAMEIKRKEYIAYREQQSNPLSEEQKNLPIPDSVTVIYKFPWNEFCRIMDEHYEELHRNPKEALEQLIGENFPGSSPILNKSSNSRNIVPGGIDLTVSEPEVIYKGKGMNMNFPEYFDVRNFEGFTFHIIRKIERTDYFEKVLASENQ